jgi:arylsulfatase A-like enzyme
MMAGKYLNRYDGPRPPLGWDRFRMFNARPAKLIDLAGRWLRGAPKDRPTFAWFSPTAPHSLRGSYLPFIPPRDQGAPECQGIAPFKPPTYRVWEQPRPYPRNMPDWPDGWELVSICEAMLSVDRLVDAALEAQRTRGRPAYLFFLSDNGMAWGQKGYPGKNVPLSTRLPFFVAGPTVSPGADVGQLLSIIDIAPTLAAMGRADMPWVDGQSFLPLLNGQPYAGRKRMLEIVPRASGGWAAVRQQAWRFIRWSNGKRELYRIADDPWEQHDLVLQRPDVALALDRALTRLVRRSRG